MNSIKQRNLATCEMLHERQNLIVIHAALDHRVDFHRREPTACACSDAVENARDGQIHVAHAAEYGVVERVEADRHAREARVAQTTRTRGEQRTIRRQRDIERLAVERGESGETFDERFESASQQRFAARDADFLDAERNECLRDFHHLIEREPLGSAQKTIVLVEDLAQHAVGATEIALVDHGEATQRPVVTVSCRSGGRIDGAGSHGGLGGNSFGDGVHDRLGVGRKGDWNTSIGSISGQLERYRERVCSIVPRAHDAGAQSVMERSSTVGPRGRTLRSIDRTDWRNRLGQGASAEFQHGALDIARHGVEGERIGRQAEWIGNFAGNGLSAISV
jgi:hypothetical protein